MIFGRRTLKLRGPDRSLVTDGPMITDHAEAEQYGHQGLRKLPRVRLGELALYYRDLGKDYYVPYDYIDRSFVRISECQPDDWIQGRDYVLPKDIRFVFSDCIEHRLIWSQEMPDAAAKKAALQELFSSVPAPRIS